MVVLGLVLVLVAIVAIVAAVLRGDDPTEVDLQWFNVETDVTGVFIAGAITGLLGVLGLGLLAVGLKRDSRKRAEVKELKQRVGRKDPARRKDSTKRSEPTPLPVTTDSQRAAAARTTDVSSSQPPGSSTGAGASTAAGSTTPVARRRPDDDATDEHFESTPRDQ